MNHVFNIAVQPLPMLPHVPQWRNTTLPITNTHVIEMYISIIISPWAHIFSVSIINHMPGLGCAHTHTLAGVCSVLSLLSYISTCCFLRGHWFRHTRGCGIDPQSSASVSRPISSAALDLTLWRHDPCRVTSDPVISAHKIQTLNDSFLFGSPQAIIFSLCLSPLFPLSLCVSAILNDPEEMCLHAYINMDDVNLMQW